MNPPGIKYLVAGGEVASESLNLSKFDAKATLLTSWLCFPLVISKDMSASYSPGPGNS